MRVNFRCLMIATIFSINVFKTLKMCSSSFSTRNHPFSLIQIHKLDFLFQLACHAMYMLLSILVL